MTTIDFNADFLITENGQLNLEQSGKRYRAALEQRKHMRGSFTHSVKVKTRNGQYYDMRKWLTEHAVGEWDASPFYTVGRISGVNSVVYTEFYFMADADAIHFRLRFC